MDKPQTTFAAHISEHGHRAKCPRCDGDGELSWWGNSYPAIVSRKCLKCDGKGYVRPSEVTAG